MRSFAGRNMKFCSSCTAELKWKEAASENCAQVPPVLRAFVTPFKPWGALECCVTSG